MAFLAGRQHGRAEADDVWANTKLIQKTLAMFPNRVRAIVRDERGRNLILSDQADVPISPPIYVRKAASHGTRPTRQISSIPKRSGR